MSITKKSKHSQDVSTATIGFETFWEMPSEKLRTPHRVFPTSTFEIHPSIFVSLPFQLFYSTQIPLCLWFLAKIKVADAKRGFRDRGKQTLSIMNHNQLAPLALAA